MNHLGMAFILPFFDSLQQIEGRGMRFLTGDGGAILKGKSAVGRTLNQDTLRRFLLAHNSIFPLATVAALTGVSRLDIVGALDERIASYPEADLEEKYGHFLLFDREFKLVFESVDRNRSFFWSTSPFYGGEFFSRAMRCPAQLKVNFLLYRHFMECLNPTLVDLESTTGPSLRLERYPTIRIARTLRRWTPSLLRATWRTVTRRPSAVLLDCLRAQTQPSSPVADYLSLAHTKSVLDRLDSLQASYLFTLTSVIEYFTSGTSSLERYRETSF
jgi:asparagine synthase (glutamine-hydrolysing)